MSRLDTTPLTATPDERPLRDRGGRRVFVVTWVLASLLGILWALATPIGASPDEPAHLVKAASVVRGEFVGELSSQGHIVQVPRYIAASHGVGCIAFRPDTAAECIDTTPDDPSALVGSTTTAGLNNPVYYALVGWPSLLFGDVAGLYVMRMVSSVLTALFLAFAVRFAFELGRPRLTLAAIGVAATPTLLFLSGAVNPNALEVTTTLAAFVAMLVVVRRAPAGPIAGPLAVAAVSAAVGAQMRGLSPLWFVVALGAPLLLLSWSQLRGLLARRAVWVTIAVIVAGAALATIWTLASSSLTGAIDQDLDIPPYPGVGASPIAGFFVMLLETFNYGTQMLASFGWLDTSAPQAVYFVWSSLIGAIALAAVGVLRGRRLVFASVLALALIFLPALAQAAFVTAGGYIWQGRYTLPLFAIAVVGAAVVVGQRLADREQRGEPMAAPRSTLIEAAAPRVFGAVWLAWGLAQGYCFLIALKRNAVGVDDTWAALVRSPEWSAPGGNLTLMVAYAVLLAVVVATAWWSTARGSRGLRPAERGL